MNTGGIVVGFVNSLEGQAALQAAADEAERRQARIILVHSSKGGQKQDPDVVIAEREALERATQELRERGCTVEVRDLVRGSDPGDDLIAVATEEQADLIVIGLRRRSAVGKLLLGSSAQAILLGADCPVLAVKARPVTK